MALGKIVKGLEKASASHADQARKLKEYMEENKIPPSQKKIKRTKISGPCKAAAKKKFKVWPSAYASGWGVRCTKAGGPSKMGKSNRKKKKT
jgi:hypothetical protein